MPSTSVNFNVGQTLLEVELDLLDKYPDCLLSKCVENSTLNGGDERINIDRDGKYLSKILAFMRNPDSLILHRMSIIELNILKNEALYYNIEELVLRIDDYDLQDRFGYDQIELVTDLETLEQIIAEETRFVILLDYERYIKGEKRLAVNEFLPLLDRNRYLVLAMLSGFDEFRLPPSDTDPERVYSLLYDPKSGARVAAETKDSFLYSHFKVALSFYAYITTSGILDNSYPEVNDTLICFCRAAWFFKVN